MSALLPSVRLVIIGGVASGASAAARARRLSETAQITLIERGPDVSFANCGLPYFVGGEIDDRASLALQTPQTLNVNLAGMAACNARDGLVDPVDELPADLNIQIVDARPPALVQSHPLPSGGRTVLNIPLAQLRKRLGELDRTRPVATVCALGKTSYFAARILTQNGFQAKSLTGGIRAHFDPRTPAKPPAT